MKYVLSFLLCFSLYLSNFCFSESTEYAKNNSEKAKDLIENRIGFRPSNIEDVTTDEIWKKLRCQLFKVYNDFVLVKENHINFLVGSNLRYLTSYCVIDLARNGDYGLVYVTYGPADNIGSYVEFWQNGVVYRPNFLYMRELVVQKVDEHIVVLKDGDYTVGELYFDCSNGLQIRMLEELPRDIIECFRELD